MKRLSILSVAATATAAYLCLPAAADTCMTFGHTVYDAGANAHSVAIGDINGDRVPDLAISNSSGQCHLLFNRGDGTFDPATTLLAGHVPQSIALGDIDQDGDLDMVVADQGIFNYTTQMWVDQGILVFLNQGGGVFGAPALLGFANGHSRPAVAVLADLDADGTLDIAVSIMDGPSYPFREVGVLLSPGDGTFAMPQWYATGSDTNCVAVGDLNGDGLVDLATTNAGSASMSILYGAGSGSFDPAVTWPIGAYPKWVAIGDLNGNGIDDIAVLNHYKLRVLLDNGSAAQYGLGLGFVSITLGDLDGDGDRDAIVPETTADNVQALINDGSGAFTQQFSLGTGGAPCRVAIGDLDGNGAPDVAYTDIELGTVAVVRHQCAVIGDLDGNGIVDAADLAGLLADWGNCVGCASDLDGDGMVGAADLAALLGAGTG